MSDTEKEYEPIAANVEVESTPEPTAEVPLYEFTEATFTSGDATGSEGPTEPAVEVTPEPVVIEEPKPKAKPEPVESVSYVVGTGDTDQVLLKQCVYKNPYARKSLTIHHLQRRLAELGYTDANADRDGWYGDLTVKSVKEFQKAKGLEDTGMMNAETFKLIFAGDKNVTVVLP
jgi:hypothetical protein